MAASSASLTIDSFDAWRNTTKTITSSINFFTTQHEKALKQSVAVFQAAYNNAVKYNETAKKAYEAAVKQKGGNRNYIPIKPAIDSSMVAKNRYEIQQLTISGPSLHLIQYSATTMIDTLKRLEKLCEKIVIDYDRRDTQFKKQCTSLGIFPTGQEVNIANENWSLQTLSDTLDTWYKESIKIEKDIIQKTADLESKYKIIVGELIFLEKQEIKLAKDPVNNKEGLLDIINRQQKRLDALKQIRTTGIELRDNFIGTSQQQKDNTTILLKLLINAINTATNLCDYAVQADAKVNKKFHYAMNIPKTLYNEIKHFFIGGDCECKLCVMNKERNAPL